MVQKNNVHPVSLIVQRKSATKVAGNAGDALPAVLNSKTNGGLRNAASPSFGMTTSGANKTSES